jgi:hypothetical protein
MARSGCRRPLKAETGVRFPLGAPAISKSMRLATFFSTYETLGEDIGTPYLSDAKKLLDELQGGIAVPRESGR